MKPYLDKIIHGDQKGFLSGRYIGEVVRTTYDLIHWAKHNKKIGLLLLIDFEKAYDSLSFSFIKKALQFLNFGENICKWVDILLNNFYAVINHCGNLSKKFSVDRGARQGDPIASYIFIICLEILAHKLRSDKDIEGFDMNGKKHLLEFYADDCSMFLKPSDENLRKVLSTLNSFYEISGLKISVSKTKAVWFGYGHVFPHKLCPDLKLDWTTEFQLLGIDFTNNLEGMEKNYSKKLEEIKNIFNHWMHRTLTVYGRSVVIKTLALPKISHLAMVLPDLKTADLKIIENLALTFLWNGKTHKVCKKDTKIIEKEGGLGMVDIKAFWQALKFSWVRRALNTNAFWPNILSDCVGKAVGHTLNVVDIFQLGPKYLDLIGKKIGNRFWSEVFKTIDPIMQGAIICFPENISSTPIWDNPLVLRNEKPIKKVSYPNLSHKIKTLEDFYSPNTSNLMSKEEFECMYQINMDHQTFVEFTYIIKNTRQRLGLVDTVGVAVFRPSQPLIIAIANSVQKGCNKYYYYIRRRFNMTSTINEREEKWHEELGYTLGVRFWNKTYKLTSDIKNDNYMKWIQFQINRKSLYTNYILNKFQATIPPSCTFCVRSGSSNPKLELISELFFDCIPVNLFWGDIRDWLLTLNIDLTISKNSILFGNHDHESMSVPNYVVLCGKCYIWHSRVNNQDISLINFQYFLFYKLDDMRNAYIHYDKECSFDQWKVIYDCLLRIKNE